MILVTLKARTLAKVSVAKTVLFDAESGPEVRDVEMHNDVVGNEMMI
jgi:hypothetical protein